MTSPATPSPSALPHVDLLRLRDGLDEAERARLEAIEEHLQTQVRPRLAPYWDAEEFPFDLLPGLAELGLGRLLTDGSSALFQHLVHAEIARVDLSLSALVGIHNELNLGMIVQLGSDEQKARWQGPLERFEAIGAFCLTEPEHGSDIAGGLETTATREGDEWVIRGAKRWIGAGTIAQVALVWARDTADGEIKGFVVPTDTPGYEATKIAGKMGLRIMQNADITLDVRLPLDAQLPGAATFDATRDLLRDSRMWVGWQGVGVQMGLLDVLRAYALERRQFGRPLAKFQMIQSQIAEVAGNLAAASGMMMQVHRLNEAGTMDMMHAAMGKATSTRLARSSAALARDAFGGNGLLSEYEVSRMMGDIEAIYSYEGSYGINALIVGRALTGVSAFV
ncbi:acyl-CoA dehydrogenase family protein [Micrococcus sp. 2A]|uniref:acyl-CoA dehydrogenase family protein n=1 Tax=Micrococcus sp. 2A TaxID=3142261 RepID=UPI0031B9B11F